MASNLLHPQNQLVQKEYIHHVPEHNKLSLYCKHMFVRNSMGTITTSIYIRKKVEIAVINGYGIGILTDRHFLTLKIGISHSKDNCNHMKPPSSTCFCRLGATQHII